MTFETFEVLAIVLEYICQTIIKGFKIFSVYFQLFSFSLIISIIKLHPYYNSKMYIILLQRGFKVAKNGSS